MKFVPPVFLPPRSGVLFGPMRTLYKVSTRVAQRVAPILEPIDDAIGAMSRTTAFAGHLVSVVKR
jgi:hypothetical protein